MATEHIVFGPDSHAAKMHDQAMEDFKNPDGPPPEILPPNPPVIDTAKPGSGTDETEVHLVGSYFQEQGDKSKVMIGKEAAVVLTWSDKEVAVVAVQGVNMPGFPLPVQLTTADGQKSSMMPAPSFEFLLAKSVAGGKTDAKTPSPAGKKPDVSLG